MKLVREMRQAEGDVIRCRECGELVFDQCIACEPLPEDPMLEFSECAEPEYLPTPDQIKWECQQIQKTWSPMERASRQAMAAQAFDLPELAIAVERRSKWTA